MLWAVTGKTAAEFIESCSKAEAANMGLTSWRGSIMRKQDVGIAVPRLRVISSMVR